MTKTSTQSLPQRIQEFWWYGPITAFSLGILSVIFFSLFGGAVAQSTELIDVSGKIITSVRMSSIGLGTGYFLGSSFKNRESGQSWFVFGVFTTLAIISFLTVDTLIFQQYPAYYLLVCGGILTTLAHLTPLVTQNDDHMFVLKLLSGYLSTAAVVLLAIIEYLLTIITSVWNWLLAQPLAGQVFIIAFITFASAVLVYSSTNSDQQHKSRVSKEANEKQPNTKRATKKQH